MGMVADAAVKLLGAAPLAAVLHDSDLVVRGWNEGAAQCFGFAEEEVVGRRLDETILAPEQVEAWRQALAEGGAPRLVECARKGGGKVRLSWRCEATGAGEAAGASYLCLAQPEPEPEARAPSLEERLLRALLDHMPISLWAVDKDGNYVFHDGLGVELVGVKRGSFLGLNMWEMWKDVEGTRETLRQTRAAMDSKQVTHAFAEAMGHTWESWCMPLEAEGGNVDIVACATMDITENKRAENELRAKLELIAQQQKIIEVLGTPIIEVWDGVLTVPLVGAIDRVRADELMPKLLGEVTRTRAQHAILDLTGVDTVDTATAAYLLDLVRAIRLLGAEAIITGIRPIVAQTIVSLGSSLVEIPTYTNLRSGLEYCMRRLSAGPPRGAAAAGRRAR